MYAENLKAVRKALKYSVKEMAEILEIPARTLGGYERSERTAAIELVTQLCNKLNVNANWFVTGKGKMFNSTTNPNKDELTIRIEEVLKEKGLIY